ncbi:hypothetical protein AB6A40_009963 [Gnathostoma spinigerum]|uniref:U3 small nucleolar RNA-associated protein 20 N-terminal domain-containing protein n=1 Tax=Gnathostoma spinigerum TaxID=75299 RepID=A0ABD6F0K6_9BILA
MPLLLLATSRTSGRGSPWQHSIAYNRVHESLLRIKKVAYAENETFALLRKVIGIEQPNPTDCVTFRLQLLTFLQQIADIAERRTVALSPLLLEIYRNEYQTIDIQSQQRQNLTGSGLNDNDDPEDVADEQRMLEESTLFEKDVRNGVACYEKYRSDSVSEGSPKKDLSNNQRNRSHIHKQREVPMLVNRVSTKKAMVAILETYAKFANPKAIFMKQEIRDLYDEMLMIPDETVQKAVLKCLFSYKYKFLNPYKENFESLVNNRTFLNELVRFGIDEQGSVVAEGHRSGLVPILMRLLCGKMKTHITKDAVTWRSAIFRFLAGCHPHELDIFVAILFGPLIEFSGSEGEEFEKMDSMCERLLCNFDITSVIPLRKLKSITCHVSFAFGALFVHCKNYAFLEVLELEVIVFDFETFAINVTSMMLFQESDRYISYL